MDKKELLNKIKLLNDDISFYYWKYYNNFILQSLYNKDIYNSIINFWGDCDLSIKQLKKYYLKNKIEFDIAISENDKIVHFWKTFANSMNNYFLNV